MGVALLSTDHKRKPIITLKDSMELFNGNANGVFRCFVIVDESRIHYCIQGTKTPRVNNSFIRVNLLQRRPR